MPTSSREPYLVHSVVHAVADPGRVRFARRGAAAARRRGSARASARACASACCTRCTTAACWRRSTRAVSASSPRSGGGSATASATPRRAGTPRSSARSIPACRPAAEREDVELIVVNNRYQPTGGAPQRRAARPGARGPRRSSSRRTRPWPRPSPRSTSRPTSRSSPSTFPIRARPTSGRTTTRPGCSPGVTSANGPGTTGTARSTRSCSWSWPARARSCTPGSAACWPGSRRPLRDAVDARPVVTLDGDGQFKTSLEKVRKHLRESKARHVLVGAANDPSALGAVRAFQEAGRVRTCAIVGQNAEPDARAELREPRTPLDRVGRLLSGTIRGRPDQAGASTSWRTARRRPPSSSVTS